MIKEYRDRQDRPLREAVPVEPATAVDLEDLYVSGQFNSASVYETELAVTIGRIDDLPMSIERATDLRDVLNQALEFHETYFGGN